MPVLRNDECFITVQVYRSIKTIIKPVMTQLIDNIDALVKF